MALQSKNKLPPSKKQKFLLKNMKKDETARINPPFVSPSI